MVNMYVVAIIMHANCRGIEESAGLAEAQIAASLHGLCVTRARRRWWRPLAIAHKNDQPLINPVIPTS